MCEGKLKCTHNKFVLTLYDVIQPVCVLLLFHKVLLIIFRNGHGHGQELHGDCCADATSSP